MPPRATLPPPECSEGSRPSHAQYALALPKRANAATSLTLRIDSSLARNSASDLSFFFLASAGGRCILDGAPTAHGTPSSRRPRASQNPVQPAS